MSSARATTLAEAFSAKLLKEMYEMSLTDKIVNRDYQGEVNDVGSKINILNISRISEKTYTGADLTADSLYEVNTLLTLSEQKSFYWTEKTIDNWKSYVKDPHSTVVAQKADERNKNMDEYLLGLYGDVGAGNHVGTDYNTGTVTVAVTTGVVTGAGGATFSAGMVGKSFKATGHTKWYRIKAYNSAQEIVIENDSDDETSAYDGGAIAGGTAYVIQANTAVAVTTSNLLQKVADLKQKLDETEKYGLSAVPDSERWLIAPPEFFNTIVRASGIVLHVPEVYTNLIKAGFQGELLGFKLFQSTRLTGDNSSGYHILAGHPNWVTFAEKLLKADIEEDLKGNFGSAYKDLFVYGAKVADSRRHFCAELFATFA